MSGRKLRRISNPASRRATAALALAAALLLAGPLSGAPTEREVARRSRIAAAPAAGLVDTLARAWHRFVCQWASEGVVIDPNGTKVTDPPPPKTTP